MKQTRAMEIATGLFVLLGIVALLFLTTQTTDIEAYRGTGGYSLIARFDNVGGLKVRAPVTAAGVTIGRVRAIRFDADRLDAEVTMQIDAQYDRLPADSDASILTAGLIGGQYIGLTPGGLDEYLKDGDEIELTQSALVLENLIGKFLVRGAGGAEQ